MYNLKIKHLVKHYNQPLLEGINLGHTGKDIIAFIGDNGSGKSTLLKILAGIEQEDSGEVSWDGPHSIGYLTQEIADHESLSGGEKKITKLAELLYSNQYDVVLLDEPDNHLDLDNKIWLEEALTAFNGLVIMISHDRAFLSNVSTKIWLLENHQIKTYPFGYSKFKAVYEEEESAKADLYKTQSKETMRLAKMALMFRDKGFIGAYHNTQKRLERLKAEMTENPLAKKAAITIQTHLENKVIKRKTAILVKDLVFSYGDQLLFDKANLHLFVQDKTALLSPNGTGKSTLINLLLGKLTPLSGEAKIGPNLRVGYYSQEHSATLPSEETPLSIFANRHPLFDYEVEAILKKFFFNRQTIRSKIWTLSGGQKSRLQLALFLYTNPDLLILDEPTNHLDLKSVEALESFLKEYQGTVLLVSHDRELVGNVCGSIYTIANHHLVETALE
ncbi:MAG: ABC-F family ATP-binding cassette domain-containing protein [Microgenomates group bacterium]